MVNDIKILYEDSDILAINKPAGLVVHFDGRTKEPNVADWFAEKYPEAKNIGEPIKLSNGEEIIRPGIVHRIDRETSGVLLLAKNQKAFEYLKKGFQDRSFQKTYHAFVYGEIKNDEGIIDRPIARSKKDFRLWSAQRGARGEAREAITEYKVLKRNEGFTFVEVNPKTGRTHQIRVHFKAINYPIICDSLYAPKRESALGFERLALHAYSIELALPSGKQVKITAPYPADFENAVKEINRA
jgi:23S rRNA pseudouridine1911/1915/1917 synthase